jgi:predicted ATP-binding protein involved in virulence
VNSRFDPNQCSTWLESLVLENYRKFERLEIGFERDLTVLVADNGGGKTAVLDSAAIALRYLVDELRSAGTHGFAATDARRANNGAISMAQYPVRLQARGSFSGDPILWSRTLSSEGRRTTTAEAKGLQNIATKMKKELARVIKRGNLMSVPELPLIAYYGTARLWGALKNTKGKKEAAMRLMDPTAAYVDCLTPASSYQQFAVWFESVVRQGQNELASGNSTPYGPAALLRAVRQAIDSVLSPTGWSNIGWDFLNGEVVAHHSDQGKLAVSSLSDGVRNLLALVADLAHRAARLNPWWHETACEQATGIVLIDEVDMHLHPSWQQSVIGLLRKAFPRVQFIVSTHSPQVLSSVDARHIRVIDDDGTVRTPRFQTRGVQSSDVLAEVMGVNPVPEVEEASMLGRYEGLIQQERGTTPEALVLREHLLSHFGADHPVMLDADKLLRFQAFKINRKGA